MFQGKLLPGTPQHWPSGPTRDALEGGGAPPPPPAGHPACAQQVPASMVFVTDSNRPQPLRQPPPIACLTASGAASEVPSLLMHPWAPHLQSGVHRVGGGAGGGGGSKSPDDSIARALRSAMPPGWHGRHHHGPGWSAADRRPHRAAHARGHGWRRPQEHDAGEVPREAPPPHQPGAHPRRRARRHRRRQRRARHPRHGFAPQRLCRCGAAIQRHLRPRAGGSSGRRTRSLAATVPVNSLGGGQQVDAAAPGASPPPAPSLPRPVGVHCA